MSVVINSLDTRLEQFKLNDQTRHVDLTNLLKEYGQLLDEYKTLKNAYENSSSRGTTSPGAVPTSTESAAAEPRNPYVLVLVDGNGYIFNDELISDKEEGGMRAARMLSEAVEKYLAHSVPHARQARVFVRIYADLTNLSKQLAKSKVVGLEKRSISSFTAGFTRAISLFDYVDALDEEGTKFKITEQFKVASEDAACSHIVFAGCHDSAYLSQLIPYSGVRDKITLVQGAGWNSEFQQFNLNITQFPTLFRWSGLPAVAPPSKAAAPAASKHKAAAPKLDRVGWEERSAYTQTAKGGQKSASKEKQPCTFFQKGVCRYGNKCNFQHIPKGFDSSNGVNGNHPPSGQSSQFFSVQSSQAPPASSQAFQNPNKRSNISSVLPTTVVHGFIPINRSHKRLDPYIPTPTQQDWKKYNTLFQEAKPCNTYHLQGICTAFPCPYDHSPIDPDTKRVLDGGVGVDGLDPLGGHPAW
ncbi:conserved hypothetical protein [Pyrenophora tritici-repentis Pt-1C-BFP]|uniref:C3H1-type domain-containing protein n=1 Tax=Pyrenophora tritici-repentis (strain Pt-1C-BFP) TaxID=426418 RepID=B2VWL5_PYRTR|nr:uncharacterized protein PTRG_01577 [Pyrenophora tritici-repentis Pt-1C-BFP]EDU41015.1 conserved hypothetical protein [Pyrenophora tritici-repentis Pt-1C-BFP]